VDWLADFINDLPGIALTWLPLIFLGLIVYLIWKSLSLMPRVRPTEVEPSSKSSVTWADIAGVDDAAAELQEVVDFLSDPRRFSKLGARVPKGVLLYGPPGTGKTLLAKAVAHASGSTFYSQSASAFVEMFAGLGAARIRKLFDRARKHAPAIVFIDELDAVGMKRSGSSFNREHDQTLNQLLVELDGFNTSAQVVIIAASNRLEDLDPALLRPGRFDRQILVGEPDLAGREAILGVHTRGKPLADDVDLAAMARQTAGLTGADLANLCNEAAIFAGRAGQEMIRAEDFEDAFKEGVKLRANALLIGQGPLTQANGKNIGELATKYRLLAIYVSGEYVDDGGLIGLGVSYPDLYRRAATYVDKILKGAKAGDLPIEQATKFDLVINLKTAKALGIAIPQSVLLRADRVIE